MTAERPSLSRGVSDRRVHTRLTWPDRRTYLTQEKYQVNDSASVSGRHGQR